MPYGWIPPQHILTHRTPGGQLIKIYRAYKDGNADRPLEFWYTTSGLDQEGCEFDVRDLPDYGPRTPHYQVITAAIDGGTLKPPPE